MLLKYKIVLQATFSNFHQVSWLLASIRKVTSNDFAGKIRNESGSASIEFVLLAIPLFLPILIFLNQFSHLSSSELIGRNLVRESLRAYVTSNNPESARGRALQTLYTGAGAEGLSSSDVDSLQLSFICSKDPCLSPEGRVQATLRMRIGDQNREVISQAVEYISPWQWNGRGSAFQPSLAIDYEYKGLTIQGKIGK